MTKISRDILILACVLVMAICYAKLPAGLAERKPQVLVEVELMRAEVSNDVSQILRLNASAPGTEVTIPVAKLLWVLRDPNSVKVLAAPQITVWPGETAKLSTSERIKFLIRKDDGSFEQKTTETAIGTTLEATPIIDKDGDILLNLKFEHFSLLPAQEIDPQTSLPIGPPMIGSSLVNNRLKLESGEPMIAGGIEKPGAQIVILVRAKILERLL